MPITINDLHDLIRLLEEHPEWRAELRRVLLTEQLLQLPDLVRDLAEAQRRTEQQLAELAAITRQNAEQLAQHTQQLAHHSQRIAELVEMTRQHSQQIAELVEMTRQHSQQIAELVEMTRQHSQQIAELAEMTRQHSQAIAELTEITRQNAEQLAQHTQQLAHHSQRIAELVEMTRQHSQQIAELAEMTRQHSQQIAELVEMTRQHSQQIAELAEMTRQHSQAIAELTEITRQNTEQLAQHTQQLAHHSQMLAELVEVTRQHSQAIAELREAQQQTQRTVERLEQTTMQLVDWQRGEAGRRRGEQYEQRVIRRAASLFAGGEGGSPEKFSVHRRLAHWIRPLYQGARVPSEDADPFLADLIWWKGNEVVVVEVSLKVDTDDVRRARQRTDTLREAGVRATPVVIGEEWAIPEIQALAQQEGVEWMVGGGLSQGFLQFRQLPSEEPSDEEPIEA